MHLRHIVTALMLMIVALYLSGCGGGGGSTSNGTVGGGGGGGGGVGGGGGAGPSISVLSPSTATIGVPLGLVEVIGQGFSQQSQVLIDGQPTPTIVDSSSLLEAQVQTSFAATAGTHQFAVQNGAQVSNSLPFTVYQLQQAPFVMEAIPGFLVGEYESNAPFIVAADVNGDGLDDVIMPGPGTTNIAILLGQPDGTLSAAQYIPVTIAPYALAVGDIDGNGTADLASITSNNSSSTTVSILLGDGHGNFQPPVTQQTFGGIYPGPAYLADLDGDGKPDLVLAVGQISGAYNLMWLKNTGGAFATPTTLATSTSNNFSIADFNGDGKPDILYTASTTPQSLHILMNQGNGRFSDQAAGGLNGVVGLATVLDFNVDGIPDLVVQVQQGNAGVLYSFAGNGKGSFTQMAKISTQGPVPVVAGDFDHDGFPDLAGPSGLEPAELLYFFGDGRGNFVLHPVVGPEGALAAVGDFNGDGIPDVVVPDRYSLVSLALGRIDRNFPSPLALNPPTIGGLSAGDINGDGLPDIFIGGDYDTVNNIFIPGTVYANLGNSAFQLGASTDPSSFMVADMTGKGVVDLVGAKTDNLEIWPNNGTLNFSPSPITLPQPMADVTIADMDGDGYPDIISACLYGTCPGQIFYGNGAYQFSPVTVANLIWPYIVGDFNGDGKLDIASSSGTFLNTGNRTFRQVAGSNLPLQSGALAVVGDFNGDGMDDVALNGPGEQTISIYYSNGDGTFYLATVLDPGLQPGDFIVGDFNGDGRTDLAVGSALSYQVCMFFNEGNGQFSRSYFASGAFGAPMIASDLNRDGKLGLVIANYGFDFLPSNVNVVFHK